MLTESGGAQIIEICSTARFTAKAGDLGLRPGFSVDLCENKPYGPHEGESWDLGKASDAKELFELIAYGRPVIVTGSLPCTAFSQLQNGELVHRMGEVASNEVVACCSGRLRFVQDACFLHEHPLGASMTALQKTEDRDLEWFERLSTSSCTNRPNG